MARISNMRLCLYFMSISTCKVIGITTLLKGSNTVAFKDEKFTLTCVVSSGNLSAVAFQKENSIIGSVNYINGECKNQDTKQLCTPDKCSCDGSNSYNWTLVSVPQSWHNSTFTCDSVFGGSTSNVYRIYVSVPVTYVHILPDIATVDILAGKLSFFSCHTKPASRPRSMVSWYTRSPGGLDTEVIDGISTRYITNGDLVVTNSTLFYNPKPDDNGKYLFCSAKTEYIQPVLSNFVQLNVLYKPESVPMVSFETTGPYFVLNSTVHVTCELTGGNPIAHLSWSCDNYNTDVTSMDASTNNTAILTLAIFINSTSLEGERCTCTAKHNIDGYMNNVEFILRLKQTSVQSVSVTSPVTYHIQQKAETQSTAAIVGGVVGGIVAILIVSLMCIYIATFKRRKETPPSQNAMDLSGNHHYDYIETHHRVDEKEKGKSDVLTFKSGYLTAVSSEINEQNNEQQPRDERIGVAVDVNTNIQESEVEANPDMKYEQLKRHREETNDATETERENVDITATTISEQMDDMLVQSNEQKDGYLEPTPKIPSVKSERKDTS